MNSDPNSDRKQCIESKLGCVHSAHTQKPGRAHTARAVPRSWALLLAWQAGRARMHAWSRPQLCLLLLPPSRLKAQVVTPNFNRPGRDLKSMSRPASTLPTEMPLSRPKTLVATPNHHKAARIMSRHQIGVATPLRPFPVATLKRGRDSVSPAQPQARSQHKNQVATLLETNLCRDIDFMSRPHFLPIVGFPGRDAKNPGHDLPYAQPK